MKRINNQLLSSVDLLLSIIIILTIQYRNLFYYFKILRFTNKYTHTRIHTHTHTRAHTYTHTFFRISQEYEMVAFHRNI